jgi:hypothetical protein
MSSSLPHIVQELCSVGFRQEQQSVAPGGRARRLGWLGRAHVDGRAGSLGRSGTRFRHVAERELIFRATAVRVAARPLAAMVDPEQVPPRSRRGRPPPGEARAVEGHATHWMRWRRRSRSCRP